MMTVGLTKKRICLVWLKVKHQTPESWRNKHPKGSNVYNLSSSRSELAQQENYLKMRASIKVKAGMRLRMADKSSGELRSMPT